MPCKTTPVERSTAPEPTVLILVVPVSTIDVAKVRVVPLATVPTTDTVGVPVLDTTPCSAPALITIGVF
jgi:hypothetical protein